MKKVLLVITVLVVGFALSASAQFRAGLRLGGGMSHSSIIFTDFGSEVLNSQGAFAFNAGFTAMYSIPIPLVALEVESGLYFTRQASKFEKEFAKTPLVTFKGTYTPSIHYISIPLLANARLDLGESFALWAGLGPQFNVGVLGNLHFKGEVKSVLGEKTSENDEKLEFGEGKLNRLMVDLRLQGGVQIAKSFRLGAYYDMGISSMSQGVPLLFENYLKTDMKSSCWGFSLAYMF